MNYDVAIVGYGSIAKRHHSNLIVMSKTRNLELRIDIFRKNLEKKDLIGKVDNVFSIEHTSIKKYDIVFITSPTNLHYQHILKFSENTSHFFIEKPLFETTNYEILKLNLDKNLTTYVACPLRYTEIIQYLKKNLLTEEIFSVRLISSSYLPEWRKSVDYRETYSANKESGGGVSLDLIHEWDYLIYLFGEPKIVKSIKKKVSDLEISSEDISLYIIGYEKMTAEIHLDYFGRSNIRKIEIICKYETIIANFIDNSIYFTEQNKLIEFKTRRNDMYINEMNYFFDILEHGVPNHNDFYSSLKTLKYATFGDLN